MLVLRTIVTVPIIMVLVCASAKAVVLSLAGTRLEALALAIVTVALIVDDVETRGANTRSFYTPGFNLNISEGQAPQNRA